VYQGYLKILYISLIAGLLMPLTQINAANASNYRQEAGILYSAGNLTGNTSEDRISGISANFTYFFAPAFISGPITQHAYSQKISQLRLESDYSLPSDQPAGSFSKSHSFAITLFPPGHSYFMDLSFDNTTVALDQGQVKDIKQGTLIWGSFLSKKLSWGVRLKNAITPMDGYNKELFPLAGKARGLFVKNILRSNRNYYFRYEVDFDLRRIDDINGTHNDYQYSHIALAVYPDRSQEWAINSHWYQGDKNVGSFGAQQLSYTNYFNKNNGLTILYQTNRGSVLDQRSVALGWKFRM